MKINDLFNQEWSQEVQNLADATVEAILNEENSRLTNVQHAAIFRELLCDAITTNQSLAITNDVENKLIAIAIVYSTFIDMNESDEIIIAQDDNGEDIVLFKS